MTDNASAGATPAAADATSTQNAGTADATATTTDAALGESGKRALETERKSARDALKRATEAEAALEALKLAGASETEKAIAQAKKDGAAEVTERANAKVRRSEVKAALASAGINASVLDLAVGAPEFRDLKVSDDGEVEGLDAAIKTFKGTRADLFKPAPAAGSSDLGTGSAARTSGGKTFTREQLKDHTFYEANKADIMAAMREGRITG